MYTFQDYREAIRLFAEGRVQAKPLVTHRFPLHEAGAAFAAALGRERALKVMLLAQGQGAVAPSPRGPPPYCPWPSEYPGLPSKV